AVAYETLVLLDLEHDENVATHGAADACIALTAQRDVVAAGYARRHRDFDVACCALDAAAAALLARTLDPLALAAAVRTRHDAHELTEERALHAPDFTRTAARGARHRRCARRGARAAAVAARIVDLDAQRSLHARRDFLERERQSH